MKAENKRNADKDKTWNNAEWSTKRSEQCPITLLRVRNVFSATATATASVAKMTHSQKTQQHLMPMAMSSSSYATRPCVCDSDCLPQSLGES